MKGIFLFTNATTLLKQFYNCSLYFLILFFILAGRQSAAFSVAEWLASIGLANYTELFEHNDLIEPTTIAALNDKDLKDAGISSLGHRKKILLKAAALSGQQGIASFF